MTNDRLTYEELEKQNVELKRQIEYLRYITCFQDNCKENIFRQLAENIDDVFWIRTDKEMIYVNPAFEKIWGISCEELYANPQIFIETIHPDDRQNVLNIFKSSAFIECGLFNYDYRIIRPDNQIRWLHAKSLPVYNDKGQIIRRVGIACDITERKNVMESNKALAEMLDIAPNSITIHDTNGNFLYANQKTFETHGFTPSEFMNINLHELDAPESETHLADRFELIAKQGYATFEIEHFRKNGTTFPLEVFAKTVFWKGIPAILSIATDITQRKKTEEELINAKNKAEESDRLKSAFLKNISHEIRTPMNAICGFSDFLLKPNLDYDKQKKYTNVVHKSIHQLLDVVENIITISFIETNQLKINKIIFSPYKLLVDLYHEYQDFQIKIGKTNISLIVDTQTKNDFFINNDYTRIKQIFKILLDNSFKFTTDGQIKFGYYLQNNQICFFVSDTGIGIPKNKQEIIFKTFTQADETITQLFGGTGIGLSIAVGLIKLIDGQLTVNSEENIGTKIEFNLPIEQTENAINKTDNNEPKKTVNITLLVAEDEEFNFQYIEELLSETKIKIIHAINGHKAVEICQNQNIDIILMDIKMPIMDGFEATKEIRKFHKTVPIIAQTAYSYKREDCINSGFTDYISKPFNQDQLIKTITQYVNR